MKSLFYFEKERAIRVGTIESTPRFFVFEEGKKHDLNRCILVDNEVGVMFPSDLQGTVLEDIWVDGYDSTLEENQDRYLHDFWKWCEVNCTSTMLRNGHVSFDFVA
jgi:hypothetical protein